MPDGKLQVLNTSQIQALPQTVVATKTTNVTTPVKTAIKPVLNTSTGKIVAPASSVKAILQQPAVQTPVKMQVVVKQQATPVMQVLANNGGQQQVCTFKSICIFNEYH